MPNFWCQNLTNHANSGLLTLSTDPQCQCGKPDLKLESLTRIRESPAKFRILWAILSENLISQSLSSLSSERTKSPIGFESDLATGHLHAYSPPKSPISDQSPDHPPNSPNSHHPENQQSTGCRQHTLNIPQSANSPHNPPNHPNPHDPENTGAIMERTTHPNGISSNASAKYHTEYPTATNIPTRKMTKNHVDPNTPRTIRKPIKYQGHKINDSESAQSAFQSTRISIQAIFRERPSQ
jgi:hypothetical protein